MMPLGSVRITPPLCDQDGADMVVRQGGPRCLLGPIELLYTIDPCSRFWLGDAPRLRKAWDPENEDDQSAYG